MASQIQTPIQHDAGLVSRQIIVTGFVQGVGFRPFVFHLANELGIKGDVVNNTGQVSINAVASGVVLEQFCERLLNEAPVNARPFIKSVTETDQYHYDDFRISESRALDESEIHILPDLPVCEQCLDELFDQDNRRYHYPFINCTQCGPRHSIITSLPYDRHNTSMQEFELCHDCEKEYRDHGDRRFHAEPVACHECGPVLNYVGPDTTITDNQIALDTCIESLKQGKIVAVKGIAGYHLMCDATSADAIQRLRSRKQRPDKPFAILLEASQLANYVTASAEELALLQGASRPIVILDQSDRCELPDVLAPGMRKLGVMLPFTPLQYLLCRYFKKPLVATSANISGEPIITDNDDASVRLATICDAYLHNDRPVVRPADDPVMVNTKHATQILRTGRGLAPTEITLPFTLDEPVLAVGGHIKNTVCLAWHNRMVVSVHNGDLGALRSYQAFNNAADDLQQLYNIEAKRIVCDAHPGYASSLWATQTGLNVSTVFHHYAHASSLFIDHPQTRDWLVFAWDGVGLGEDGTLWGGETFLGGPGHWQRVASFESFLLPGGEKATRETWRVATSLCWQADMAFSSASQDVETLREIWEKEINCPRTSSAGRLFSAAAALIGLVEIESYEGHGPVQLEALAETVQAEAISLPTLEDATGVMRIDWRPIISMLLDELLSKAYRARCFHETMAECISKLSQYYTARHGELAIGFSGGVFQNQLLLRLIRQRLAWHRPGLLLPTTIPVNDGGLCVGQLVENFFQ